MRLIDANEAIKILNHAAEVCNSGFTRRILELVAVRVETLKTIEAEPVNATDTNVGSKWIPVMEMEPERTGWFLTFGPQRKTAVVHFDSDGVWSDEDDYNIDVTHWMPLPKPPDDGGAENAK